MRLYVAGPMTGHEDLNRAAFDAATDFLRGAGHEVSSPVELSIELAGTWEAAKDVNADGAAYAKFLTRDIVAVAKADAIAFLPGWEESRGARAEAEAGLMLNKTFYLYDATRAYGLDPISLRLIENTVLGTGLIADAFGRQLSEVATAISAAEAHADVEAAFHQGLQKGMDVHAYDGERFVPYSENPQRHVFGTGGIKDNRGKARIDLIPTRPLLAVAEILEFGAIKYRPHNWRRGLPWPDTYSSLQRHLLAWNDGEDLDKETGKSHLAHAACQLVFLLDYVLTGVGEETDKRFIPCPCEREGLHPTTDHDEENAA